MLNYCLVIVKLARKKGGKRLGLAKELWLQAMERPLDPNPINNPDYLDQLKREKTLQAFLREFLPRVDEFDRVINRLIKEKNLDWESMLASLFKKRVVVFRTREGEELDSFKAVL